MKQQVNSTSSIVSLLIFIWACSAKQEAVPIAFGKDQCTFCKMIISNPQFGAELITDKGRILKYDGAECLINHLKNDAPTYQKLYVVAYDKSKELETVETLYFLISPDFRSPMGANLAAFSDKKNVGQQYQTQLIDWQTLLKIFE